MARLGLFVVMKIDQRVVGLEQDNNHIIGPT